MELKFRPEDALCHPIFGDYSTKSNIILKIKKKRKVTSEVVTETEIVGIMHGSFEFQGI
jgi:hypothetical protein